MAEILYTWRKDQELFNNLKQFYEEYEVYIEKSPFKKRRELTKLLGTVENGDTIFVDSFSILVDTTAGLFDVLKKLQQKNVNIVSRKEDLDTRNEKGRIMLGTIGAVAQF